MRRAVLALPGTLAVILLFCGWYASAANYDYSALAGTYHWHDNLVSCTLVLKADATFTEERTDSGKVSHATGTWRRIGEGGVAFSSSFLRLPGQRSLADSPGSDASKHLEIPPEFYGHFEKILTLYPELMLEGQPEDRILHRRLFF